MKYPIGIQSFDRIIEDGFVYVDKTGLIYNLTSAVRAVLEKVCWFQH